MSLIVSRCTETADAPALARFFVDHVTPDYISHGELTTGRATAPGVWAPDLEARVLAEMREAIAEPKHHRQVLTARKADELLAVCMVCRDERGIATIEDLVVAQSQRGQGVGRAVVEAVLAALAADGVVQVLLESGVANAGAHRFFEGLGFEMVSKVFYRRVGPS